MFMSECKLGYLRTEFAPDRISLLIELIPLNAQLFDLPIDEVGDKLNAVANYARTTFAVRTAPNPAITGVAASRASAAGRPPANGAPVSDRKQRAMRKVLEAGPSRAIQVLEGELARAKEGGDPKLIKLAEEQLARANAMKERISQPHGNGGSNIS